MIILKLLFILLYVFEPLFEYKVILVTFSEVVNYMIN